MFQYFSLKLLLLFLLLFQIPYSSYGQYFGRNKVQYEDFDFNVLKTEHFDIHYYEAMRNAAYDGAAMLERWNSRFSKIFGKDISKNQPIVLYADHPDFQQTNVISGLISQGTGGVTEGLKNRIILPFTGINSENDHVLGHELVHAFQYEMIKGTGDGLRNANQIPLWFIEGLAEYLSVGKSDPLTAMWLRDAVINDDVPTIDDVSSNYKYFPYRYGHALWNYIASEYGDETIQRLFQSVLTSGWEEGFKSGINMEVDSLSELWRNEVISLYEKQLEGKTKSDDLGEGIITGEERMNLSPVISPNGKYIALLTQGDIFSIDLYLADAYTGELLEELVSSNTDRHFDALRFINSAGSWSPDSRKFAFVVIEDGDDKIAVLDVESGNIEKIFRAGGVTSISHLAWSPDGNHILLAGTIGGINDLFLYDLSSGNIDQITNDKFSEIHPSWSPDGNYIVYSTDKSDLTKLENYKFAPMQISLYNINTKSSEIISLDQNAKHINPLFTPSGESIIFISDKNGINDLYRYELGNGTFYRITNAATGISGLTELSPAASIAENGRLIFSIFNNTNYDVRALNEAQLRGEPVSNDKAERSYAAIPPAEDKNKGIVTDYLADYSIGLPPVDDFSVNDYTPSLRLLYVSQPSIGIAVDRFGTAVGGGASLIFGDMLGNHMLGAAIQSGGGLKDLGGQVIYLNRKNRINWGGTIGHIPYLTGAVRTGIDTVTIDGQQYLANDFRLIRQRIFNDNISLLAEYPLSTNRRFEFSTGYTRISYDFEEEQILFVGNSIFSTETRELDSPPAVNLFQTSAAYVGDYSFFGFTSPVNGSRFRFEAMQTLGSLQFSSFLGDYRRYFFADPVTFAFRGMHYGRYFGDSEDDRLTPLNLGYETLIRGYSISSFDITECTDPNGNCEEIDRLFGSKLAVFNFEIRLPVFGTEQFGLINFPYLPLELSAFFDAGAAWTSDEDPVLKFDTNSSERIPVFSSGLAGRVNLLGYIIVQVYYAYPFQRPQSNGEFGFVISPGW